MARDPLSCRSQRFIRWLVVCTSLGLLATAASAVASALLSPHLGLNRSASTRQISVKLENGHEFTVFENVRGGQSIALLTGVTPSSRFHRGLEETPQVVDVAEAERLDTTLTRRVLLDARAVLGNEFEELTTGCTMIDIVVVRQGWPLRCVRGVSLFRSISTDTISVWSDGHRSFVDESITSSHALRAFKHSGPVRSAQFSAVAWSPMALGIAVNTLLYAAVVFSVAAGGYHACRIALGRLRRVCGCCPGCGYDLCHDLTQRCPECGWNRKAKPSSRTIPTG